MREQTFQLTPVTIIRSTPRAGAEESPQPVHLDGIYEVESCTEYAAGLWFAEFRMRDDRRTFVRGITLVTSRVKLRPGVAVRLAIRPMENTAVYEAS